MDTLIFDEKKEKLKKERKASSCVYDNVPVEENLKKEELNELIRYAYKTYYINPKYIMQRILSIRGFAQLKAQVKAGLGLLKI